ncbi:MAG: biopolymer transporter ExbD [Bacteroidetes bacterium]|nr:MAG: biopolymer transporter ExbD [Bacteroidota bacterium]
MMASKEVPEINAGSMADIAFLLLIFFLVTTTMDVDTGITRKLPPPVEDDTKFDIKDRNIFKVLVSSSDRLMVEGERSDISTLRDDVKAFMTNPTNREDLPEKELKFIENLGDIEVSKGVVSLKNDRGTSYEMYIKIQNELTAAFAELRDEVSLQFYGVKFKNLINEDYRKAVKKAVPMAISEAEPENIGGN